MRVRHFLGAASQWGAPGGRPAPQQDDSGGKIGRTTYTDVVTRSMAWLTSFLLESSPLAAFLSFRKFSTVFFMLLSSPGWGVARLRSVLWKANIRVSVWASLHHSCKSFPTQVSLPRATGRAGESLPWSYKHLSTGPNWKEGWKCCLQPISSRWKRVPFRIKNT